MKKPALTNFQRVFGGCQPLGTFAGLRIMSEKNVLMDHPGIQCGGSECRWMKGDRGRFTIPQTTLVEIFYNFFKKNAPHFIIEDHVSGHCVPCNSNFPMILVLQIDDPWI